MILGKWLWYKDGEPSAYLDLKGKTEEEEEYTCGFFGLDDTEGTTALDIEYCNWEWCIDCH